MLVCEKSFDASRKDSNLTSGRLFGCLNHKWLFFYSHPLGGGVTPPPIFTLGFLAYIYFFTWISPSIHVICIYMKVNNVYIYPWIFEPLCILG